MKIEDFLNKLKKIEDSFTGEEHPIVEVTIYSDGSGHYKVLDDRLDVVGYNDWISPKQMEEVLSRYD